MIDTTLLYPALVTLVLILSALYLFLLFRHYKTSLNNTHLPAPPLPQSSPFLGLDLFLAFTLWTRSRHFLANTSSLFQLVNSKTFSLKFLGTTRIWTVDPANIKAMLQTQSADFELGWIRIRAFRPYLGEGPQAVNGEKWMHGRALLRGCFAGGRKEARDAELALFERHFGRMAGLLRDSETVDLQKVFPRLTMDVSTELLFGESVCSLQEEPSRETKELERSFEVATTGVVRRFNMGNLIWFHYDRQFNKAIKTIHAYTERFVDRALELREKEGDTKNQGRDGGGDTYEKDGKRSHVFIEALAKDTGDRKVLRDQLVSVFTAGRNSTASLLSLVFYLLARHPDVISRLRQEITSLGGEPPSYEQLKGLVYLRWVIDETLRLYPIAPINERQAKRDTFLPRGAISSSSPDTTSPPTSTPLFIPKGRTVLYHTYALHHDPSLWGPDSLDFNPSRWEGLSRADVAWKFVPFGGGARLCPGQTLALTETSYITVRMLQTFSSLENRDPEPFVEGLGAVFHSGRGVLVALAR